MILDGVLLKIDYVNKKTNERDYTEFILDSIDIVPIPPLFLENEDSMQVEIIPMIDFNSDDFNLADFN